MIREFKIISNLVLTCGLCLFLVACNGSKDETKTTDTTNTGGSGPNGEPVVISMPGGAVLAKASVSPLTITSQIIYNELEQQVRDNYEFIVTPDEGITVAQVGGTAFTSTLVVRSLNGKIQFDAILPTKVGAYRIAVKPKNSISTGRFFITVDPGPVALLGEIKGTRWEDKPDINGNYNNQKDLDESWSILGDGQSTTYLSVGPIMDQFANSVNTAKIRLVADSGAIVTENPATISDGKGFFTYQSFQGTGLVALSAVALDASNNPITAPIVGQLQVVQPNVQIVETGDFGNVFVNETNVKTFTVKNVGSTAAKSVVYTAEQPFLIKSTSSCLTKTTLNPNDTCQLQVEFTGGIRSTFTGILKVIGTPTTVSTSQASVNLVAHTVVKAQMNLSTINLDFNTQICGGTYTQEVIVSNTGDLPGTNFTITNPQPHPGQTVPFITFISPQPTGNESSDPNEPINCGNTLQPGRKCRIIATFNPQAIVSNAPLTATFTIDGQAPINLTVRGASQPGPPVGNIPILLTTPDEQSQQKQLSEDSMNLSDVEITTVSVGPIKDACGTTVANGYQIGAAVSAGTLVNATEITNNGIATFAWKGTSDPAKIGEQSITVTSSEAQGIKPLTFKGVRMVMTGPSDLGQVLTTKPRTYEFTITNSGNLPIQNLDLHTDPANLSWGNIDFTYQGGCQDFTLLAGETCTVRFRAAPSSAGTFTGKIIAESLQSVGQNSQSIQMSAVGQLPPVIHFLSSSYSLGNFTAGTPITGYLDLKNDGPATANNLAYSLAAPFVITQNDCSTTLVGGATCRIYVSLSTNIKGTYSTSMQVTSEANSASANISGSVTSNKPAGTLTMNFDQSSVPAATTNPNAKINVTVGPIKDTYGNIVVAGTKVVLTNTAGRMSVDLNADNTETLLTDASGMVSFSIRAASNSEITSFTVNAKVFDIDNTTLLLQTSKSGTFTGARLAFQDTSVVFGQVALGRLEIKSVTLKNTGNETASSVAISSGSSDFQLSGQNVSSCTTILAGGTCTFSVTFFPAQTGVKNSTISVTASGNGVLSGSIPVSGEGVLPADIVLSPASLVMDVAPGATGTASFTITNSGAEALTSLAIASSTRNSEFTYGGISTCQTLAGGQACTINMVFNPTAALSGNISATITATGQSPSRPTVGSVSLTIRPASLIFKQKPTSLAIGACGGLQIESQNSSQAPMNAANTITLNLSKTGGTGTFYSDSGCSSSITTIQLLAGNSSTNLFYYKGSTAGDHTLTANNTLFSVQTIVKLYAPLTFAANDPSIATARTYTYVANGGVAPLTYSVRTAGGGTINSSSGLYTAPNTAGTYVIRATDNLGNFVETNALVYNPLMSAGSGYVCYSVDGTLTCWGQNAFGQWNTTGAVNGTYLEKVPTLSQVTFTPASGVIKQMFAGSNHMCYVRSSDNQLYCQGLNNLGQLGNNSTNDSSTSSAVTGSFTVPLVADLTGYVSAGFGEHTCAIKQSDNQAYCWGSNAQGQVLAGATPYTNAAYAKFLTPQKITLPTGTALQVAASKNNTCVLLSDKTVYCFGTGLTGDNGVGNGIVRTSGGVVLSAFKQLSAGMDHFCAVDTSNQLYCWGYNPYGQVGDNSTTNRNYAALVTTNVAKVYSGAYHNCAVKLDSSLVCWGRNNRGQIGDNTLVNKLVPTTISGITPINSMALGRDFSCVINGGNAVRCWGDNAYGISIDVPTINRQVPTLVAASSSTCSSGMTYNSGSASCKCTTATQIYTADTATAGCVAAPTFSVGTPANPIAGFKNPGDMIPLTLEISAGGSVATDVPVYFANTSGSATYNHTRILSSAINQNASVPVGRLYNQIYKSSADIDQLEIRIGNSSTVKASTTLNKYQDTCLKYYNVYGYTNTSKGPFTLGITPSQYAGYCVFSPDSYTYTNVTDYNNSLIAKDVTGVSSSTMTCPINTTIIWNTGKIIRNCNNGAAYTKECFLPLMFSGANSGVVNDSDCSPAACDSPLDDLGTLSISLRWNCK